MVFLSTEFLPLLDALDAAGVRYLLIGGFAVNIHGYSRGTLDLDIWLEPGETKRDAFIRCMEGLGYAASELGNLDFTRPQHLSLPMGTEVIDFVTALDGVNFREAYTDRHAFQQGEKNY
jgi:hypothetical protein